MGDDDSLFFVDNWVDVLEKYDHNKYVYIGGHSEFFMSNIWFSFDQGFGGAGFALSYPLVAAMVKDLEGCLRRYPYLNSADLITQYCVDELGVPLSAERGIHQIDLHGDISGFLSSHPQSPILSLHFDQIEPIFPTMNRSQSANHLMKAAKTDQSRMLQQTICYQKQTNWSFSISWGYSAHIYEKVLPRSVLKRPLETFLPWLDLKHRPYYMFNTRWPPFVDSCEAPHVFFFESIDSSIDSFEGHNQIVMTYVRSKPRGLPTCSLSGSRSADSISKVRVFSLATKLPKIGRSECCDVVKVGENNITEIKIRTCRDDEIIA
ncbi:uncharacterized protein LOC114284745 [Camellia sinensis]|uniref:uncharacterized protein LOC114284745 n=1 Tax=Camellia sinensis TaxID=4442 RepID=UPI00103623EC|nr:uncharacterized protein LOC114284745 [Camellia sinensis]